MFFGGGDAGDEDADEWVGFVYEIGDSEFVRPQFSAADEFEPALGFTKFLEGDTHLVNKLSSGFGGLGFPVVGQWRCARTQSWCPTPPAA